MKTVRITVLFVALAVVGAACGATDETTSTTSPGGSITTPPDSVPFVNGELIKLDLPRSAVAVDPADLAAVVRGDAALGLDVFGAVAAGDNVMISPYSIATALSMLYPGARGTTADEIAAVLHLSVDDDTLHATRNLIEQALSAAPPPPTEDDTREPFTIRPANSAWGQGGFPFTPEYLEVLATAYDAGLRVVDFAADPDGSRQLVNDWVEETTEDRIKDLIPPGVVDVDTRLILVNAIWFKANWFEPFNAELTAAGTFQLLDGTEVTVPLMQAGRRGGYADTGKFTAVRLPYAGDATMVVMLPPEGTSPAQLAASLSPDDLAIDWADHQIDLTLPSFEFESEIGLKEALQSLGMVAAFEQDQADLSGIADRDLFVQDALHKSFIALDEEGTEAAAATALVIGIVSAPPPATFTADRPFLFYIEHGTTGEMLFLGQVTDPS